MDSNIVESIAIHLIFFFRYVCHVISTTYQRIPEERLCELLGLQDEDMMNQWIGNFKSKPHIYYTYVF